jgi:hypothetical protein
MVSEVLRCALLLLLNAMRMRVLAVACMPMRCSAVALYCAFVRLGAAGFQPGQCNLPNPYSSCMLCAEWLSPAERQHKSVLCANVMHVGAGCFVQICRCPGFA